MERNFFAFPDSEDQSIFINVNQIRQVVIGPNGCDIWFSESHKIRLGGVGLKDFMERIGERAVALDGQPINLKNVLARYELPSQA